MARNSDTRNLLVLLLVVLGVLVLFPALVMGFSMMGVGGMMGGHMWSDATAPGWLPLVGIGMPLLFLSTIVVAGYLLYSAVAGDDDPAIEEVRSAYARGDLSEEEYERRREALERDHQG